MEGLFTYLLTLWPGRVQRKLSLFHPTMRNTFVRNPSVRKTSQWLFVFCTAEMRSRTAYQNRLLELKEDDEIPE